MTFWTISTCAIAVATAIELPDRRFTPRHKALLREDVDAKIRRAAMRSVAQLQRSHLEPIAAEVASRISASSPLHIIMVTPPQVMPQPTVHAEHPRWRSQREWARWYCSQS